MSGVALHLRCTGVVRGVQDVLHTRKLAFVLDGAHSGRTLQKLSLFLKQVYSCLAVGLDLSFDDLPPGVHSLTTRKYSKS